MPYTLAFADSELRDITRDGALVRLRLSAAAVRDEAGERGWLTGVSLELSDAAMRGDTAHAFGRIAEGALDGAARLDVPASRDGAIELTLRLANGTQLAIAGRHLDTRLADDARFTPDLSC